MEENLILEAVPLADPVARAVDLLATTRSPGVQGDDPWSEAGWKVLRFHLARMLSRVPGVIAAVDPEEVHAMRAASRRVRAAWRVFGDGSERGAARRNRRDLREVGGRLGAVRDLDVLLGILDAYLTPRSPRARAALLPLWNAWVAERQAHQELLVGFVSSPAFMAFVECEAFLSADRLDTAVERPPSGRVRTRMPARAWAAYGDVWAFDERLEGAGGTDLAVLHQLRIAGKWLRYTLEFTRETLGSDAALLIEPIVALQDHLGDQHDLHVAAMRGREFAAAAGTVPRREAAELDRFVRHLEERVDRHHRRFDRVWQPIVTPRYRARLGRALNRQ